MIMITKIRVGIVNKMKCDICKNEAVWDAKILRGPWAYMCQECYDSLADKTPKLAIRLKNETI